MADFRRFRLFFLVLEVRIWLVNACPLLILPEPVFLKRLAAPLFVLILGILFSFNFENVNIEIRCNMQKTRNPKIY